MKDNFFVYSVGILAIVGILVCFIGYATNTLPMHTSKQTHAITIPTAKKKNCKCCADRLERIIKANKEEKLQMLCRSAGTYNKSK
jgi:hypothetical protein